MRGRVTHSPVRPAGDARHVPSPGQRTTSPGATAATLATLPHGRLGGAVVLLAASEAVVARTRPDGRDEIVRVRRRTRVVDAPPFFVRLLREVGDRAPVVFLGSAAERTALERLFVAIGRQPDRILDEASVHDAHPEALLERLRALRSHPG
jgi:hypothetical protein